jgi:hypothetical protein
MRTAFRFRLYPNSKQEARMLQALEAARKLWKDALAHWKARSENDRQATSYVQPKIEKVELHGHPVLS